MPRIKVRSVSPTFHRAKIKFTKNPSVHEVDEKTLKILQAEPMLVVEVLPEEKAKEPGKESGKESGKKA